MQRLQFMRHQKVGCLGSSHLRNGQQHSFRACCYSTEDNVLADRGSSTRLQNRLEWEKIVNPVAQEHVPGPRCGRQPVATKGKTYWTARCESEHFPQMSSGTPIGSKKAALAAWDDDVKRARIG